jgi:hypothetical protein
VYDPNPVASSSNGIIYIDASPSEPPPKRPTKKRDYSSTFMDTDEEKEWIIE